MPALAARKLVDFSGPHGWEHSAINLGRTTRWASVPAEELPARQRRVLPLVELRTDFVAGRRGPPRRRPGRRRPRPRPASTRRPTGWPWPRTSAVFHGWEAAGHRRASPRRRPTSRWRLGDDYARYPGHVARAVEILLQAGVSGPYGLALGPDGYTGRGGDHRARRA